jgi:hypothetical protein
MNKIYAFLSNKKSINFAFVLFVLVYIFFTVVKFSNSEWNIHNNDDYKGLFIKFNKLGYYQAVSQGTSLVYNSFLNGIFEITKNVNASFFIVNLFSDLILLIFGCFFCRKITDIKNIFFYIILTTYSFLIINMRSYLSASNDSFLGVFVVFLLYLLVVKLFETKGKTYVFIGIGFVFAICLSVRITAILLLPLIFIAFFYWLKNSEIDFLKRMQLIGMCFLTFVLTICTLHYPAIKERQTLSYENKNPSKELNWIQRNYLGLKKIENGQEKVHRDAIWKNTKFDKVQEYLNIHGANSLPKTFIEVLIKDPILVFKITFLNIITCFITFFRQWGFLFFIPIITLFKRELFDKYKLSTLLFLSFMFALSFVCFTFIEFRWFYGYAILIPISILFAVNKKESLNESCKIHSIVVTSLLLITLFNVKAIITLLYS